MKAEPVSRGQSLNLHPLNDCVLVELKQSTDQFSVKEAKYDSRTEGIVVEVPKGKMYMYMGETQHYEHELFKYIGKRIFFEDFKEGARIKRNGKIYSFIKIEDIRGYED